MIGVFIFNIKNLEEEGGGGGISEKCVNLGTQEIGFIGLIWHI